MKYLSVLFALFILDSSKYAEAQKLGTNKAGIPSVIGLSCFNCAEKWNFGCGTEKIAKECRCKNTEFLGTVFNCINSHAGGEEDILWGYSYVKTFCHHFGNAELNYKEITSIYRNATRTLLDPADHKSTTERLYNPIGVTNAVFQGEYNAASTAKNQYKLGTIFGLFIISYWLSILLGASIIQVMRNNFVDGLDRLNSPAVRAVRKYLTLPALIGSQHMSPVRIMKIFKISAPTRGQSLILLGYIALNIVFSSICYQTYLPNPYLSTKLDQLLRYIGNRTGIIAFTQLPLVVVFASRNNPFIHLTGFSYHSFQVYHHWIARMMTLHALVHSVCFTWIAMESHTLAFRWLHIRNWRFGNMAIYITMAMIIFAMGFFRVHTHELFKKAHFVFFLMFFLALWFHCIDFGWMIWLYITLACYLLEYVLRTAKSIYSGGLVPGTFSITPDGNIKVDVKTNWYPLAGNYVYLRVMTGALFWQQHPFTVYEAVDKSESTLKMYIKPKEGATRTLYNILCDQENTTATMNCVIEGPYGITQPLDQYDSVLLVAGGMGITSAYSYAVWILNKHLTRKKKPSVVLIWVVKSSAAIASFQSELNHLLDHPDIFNVRIFVTCSGRREQELSYNSYEPSFNSLTTLASSNKERVGASKLPSLSEASIRQAKSFESTNLKWGKSSSSQIRFEYVFFKKPSVRNEVRNFINFFTDKKAITTCGPPNFVDDVRQCIVENILHAPERIDYFEESFSW